MAEDSLTDREKDVISPEEFEKLEQTESKKSLVKRLFSSKKDDSKKDESVDKEKKVNLTPEALSYEFQQLSKKLDDLQVTIEMQGGKLEMEKELRGSLNERIIDLSSQLGELRSVLMSKERLFDKVEAEFSQFQSTMEQINPATTQAELDKKDLAITAVDAKVEKNSSFLESMQSELKDAKELMVKIGSFEQLVSTLDSLDERVKEIFDIKDKTEQTLLKVESLFVELNEKNKMIEHHQDHLSELDSRLSQSSKQLVKVERHLSDFAKKDDVERMKKYIQILKKNMLSKDMDDFDLKTLSEYIKSVEKKVDHLSVQQPPSSTADSSSTSDIQLPREIRQFQAALEMFGGMKRVLEVLKKLDAISPDEHSLDNQSTMFSSNLKQELSSVDESSVGKDSVQNKPVGKDSVQDDSVGGDSVDNSSVQTKPVDNSSVDESSVGGDSVDNSSVQNKPVGNSPVNESTTPVQEKLLTTEESSGSVSKSLLVDHNSLDSLVDFFKKIQSKNKNPKDYVQQLLDVGWSQKQVDEALSMITL